ncbi:hypothetical protein PR003_g33697, partial [Phytophthora rubi]
GPCNSRGLDPCRFCACSRCVGLGHSHGLVGRDDWFHDWYLFFARSFGFPFGSNSAPYLASVWFSAFSLWRAESFEFSVACIGAFRSGARAVVPFFSLPT